MHQDNFYKITQTIINKYRQEVLDVLKTGDLTSYTYCEAQHEDYGTYDANYDARHRIARGLQFTPELDGQEGVEVLIRSLLKEEIKDRETNSFQGIGSTVEILVQLLQLIAMMLISCYLSRLKKLILIAIVGLRQDTQNANVKFTSSKVF